jgi:CheY-like chemotaxis protein
MVAQQAAIALENARLYRTVRSQKEQLEVAVEAARAADRRKDEFLAMLGHELRNPLAPITTSLALMEFKADKLLERERRVIGRQVSHLTRLVDDLLDVSRIVGGKIQLSKQTIEIASVIASAAEMASPLLENRRQELVLDVPSSGLLVEADPERLAQVFQNLLTNASKYSDPRSRITVRAYGSNADVLVDVEDHGIGISPDLLPQIFDLFVQGQRSIDRAKGGLGIGLSIAKSLCEMHGGGVTAKSDDGGSQFTVRLPRAKSESRTVEASVSRTRTASSARRILLVDDNVDAAESLAEVLALRGHHVVIAHDPVSALRLAESHEPAVAILDIGLPVMDGYELAAKLREQTWGKSLSLIALTGYGQENDKKRAASAGFSHHLVKPVKVDELELLLEPGDLEMARAFEAKTRA